MQLARITYVKIGGPADHFCAPRSLAELQNIDHPHVFILGAGSNLLVADSGFRGCVISMEHFVKIHLAGLLYVGAGMRLFPLLRYCQQQGLSGLECLAGIPGSLGGALAMNAGTSQGSISSCVESIELYSFSSRKVIRMPVSSEHFSYRANHFLTPDTVILGAYFKYTPDAVDAIQSKIMHALEKRKASQPVSQLSFGSVFKNPPGESAWQVIENIGLRGYKIGDAQFSEKHANFIINHGHARAQDVKALIELAQQRALALGIALQTEVVMLGFDSGRQSL